jgi:hypothetical protein
MAWMIVRFFFQFLHTTCVCLWCDIRDRLAGRRLDWRLIDVVIFCWNAFTLRALLCWRASQYDRRMRKSRRVKGLK